MGSREHNQPTDYAHLPTPFLRLTWLWDHRSPYFWLNCFNSLLAMVLWALGQKLQSRFAFIDVALGARVVVQVGELL
jgi:hypothetical protein